MIRKHFRIRRLALGLAFAAVVVPTAQATPYGGGPTTQDVATASVLSTDVSSYELRGTHIVPNGMTLTATDVVRSENSFGVDGPSAGGATGPSAVDVISTSSTSSFDWRDAGIGASVALVAALMLLTAVGFGRRHRSRSLASA